MPLFSKILFPFDFSDRCAGMVGYAAALARANRAELTLFHVIEEPVFDLTYHGFESPAVVDIPRSLTPERTQQLEDFAPPELEGLDVRRVVTTGDPAASILKYAKTENMDLIVMPTHGYGIFRRFLLGSVTAKVLHDTERPVLTGAHVEEGPIARFLPIRNILCAVDLGQQSLKVLRWAAALAAGTQANLVLAHILPPVDHAISMQFGTEWHLAMEASAREALKDLLKQADEPAEISICHGDVPVAIASLATTLGSDLVVIGRTPPGESKGRLHSDAYGIIRQSGCPVMSV